MKGTPAGDTQLIVSRRGLDEIAGCSRMWCVEQFEAAVASVRGAGGKLPHAIELIIRKPCAGEQGCSGTAERRRGYGYVTIFDTDVVTPASVVVTMLHELTHLANEPDHDEGFRRLYLRALYKFTLARPFNPDRSDLFEALVQMPDDEVAMGLDEVGTIAVTLFLSGGRQAPLSLFDMASGFAYAVRGLGLAEAWKLAREFVAWRWLRRPSWA